MSLEQWCKEDDNALKLNLHPRAQYSINTLPDSLTKVRLLIGPEGGLSTEEIANTRTQGFEEILLGPRVLRTRNNSDDRNYSATSTLWRSWLMLLKELNMTKEKKENRELDENEINLKGQFLIAMPSMRDPYFEKTVVYICDHNKDGAIGITINHPIDLTIDKMLERVEMTLPYYNETIRLIQPVFNGGPVLPEKGFVLHNPLESKFSSTLDVSDSIQITTSKDILETLGTDNEPQQYLVALGYAEWEAGQLERELQENAWLTSSADPNIIFNTPIDERWNEAINQLGFDLLHLSSHVGHA